MRISDWSSDVCSSDLNEARKRTADITEAQIVIIPPPLIQGIGSAGGYRMIVQDRGGHGYAALANETNNLIGKANERSEEHTSELQSLMRTSYAVFCLKKKKLFNFTKILIAID